MTEISDEDWDATHASINSARCYEVAIKALRERYLMSIENYKNADMALGAAINKIFETSKTVHEVANALDSVKRDINPIIIVPENWPTRFEIEAMVNNLKMAEKEREAIYESLSADDKDWLKSSRRRT